MQQIQNRESGFTLLELIIVIVILGVLAVVAAPRFIDVTTSAKIAKIESIAGSFKSTIDLVHMKAQIENKLGENDLFESDFGDYEFVSGYPEPRSEGTDPYLYVLEAFLDLGTPTSLTKDNTSRTASHGELLVYEVNGRSKVGFPDSTGDLDAGDCYAEYVHFITHAIVRYSTDGC